MGLNPLETVLFCSGSALVLRFLSGSVLPRARKRILSTADRRASELREEFVSLPPSRIALLLCATGAVSAGTALIVAGSVVFAAVAGIAPILLSGAAVRRFRARRNAAIRSRLPVLLDLLAGHVKAGHSVQQSLVESEPLLPPGIREEIAWILQQVRLGVPIAEALAQWEDRIGGDESALVVRPLCIAMRGGGNVAELLERTRDILRMRIRMREKIRSMTAQARLQAAVLTILPPGFGAVLSLVDPDFLPSLLGTARGHAILVAAALLLSFGWIFIRRILAVRP